MSRSITRNYAYNVSYQILAVLTPIVTTPYLSRVLGADGIGTFSFTTSVVSYFILLATLGVSSYAQREIAYHRDDVRIISRTFYEIMLLKTILVITSLLTYYIFVMAWQSEAGRFIYWIQALNILAVLFDISWFFQGMEEFGKIVFRNLFVRVLNIAMIFFCIKEENDLLLYIGLLAGMNILAAGLLFQYMPRYLVRISWHELKPWRNFCVMLELFLPTVAIQVYTVLDKTMLGMFTGSPAENGYYEQAEKIVKVVLTVVTSLGTVMLPRIAYAYAHQKIDEVERYMLRSFRFVWALSLPLMLMIMAIAVNLVPWFFGDGFAPVVQLMKLLALLLPIIGLSNVIGIQYLLTTNQQNLLTMSVTGGAVVNFVLNLLLIPSMASLGAALASVLAELVVTMIQFYFVRKVFDLFQVLKLGRIYLVSSLVMFTVVYLFGCILYPSFMHTLLLGIIGVIVYLAILAWRRDDILLYAYEKVHAKMQRIFL